MEPMNREQRRHPERVEREAKLASHPIAPPDRPQSPEHDLVKARNPDVMDARAKNSGHGKKTADKWNQ
jgi:hypothetical protein